MERVLVCDYNSSDVWVLSADDLSLVDTLTFPDGYPAVVVGDATGYYMLYFKSSAVTNLFKYDLDLNFLWSVTLGAGVSPVSSIYNPTMCQDDDNVYVYTIWKNGITIIAKKIYKISKADGSITQDVATYSGYLCDSLMIYAGSLYHFVTTGYSRWLKLSTADLSFVSEQDVTVWPYTHAAYYASDGLVFFGIGQADADFWKFDPSDHSVLQTYPTGINVNDPTYDYLSFCQVTGGKVIVMQQRDPYVDPIIEIAAYDIATGLQVVKTTVGAYGWWIGLAVGLPPPATPSFDDTREELVGQARLSIYLSEEIDAFDVFAMINAAVASYLFNDHLGKYRYVAYMPPAGATLPQFTEDDIFSFSEDVDASGIISRVKAKYQHRVTQDYWQVRFVERPEAQYLQRSPVAILKEVEFPFVRASDGLKGGQRTALMEGVPQRVYKAKVSSKAWTLLPSDFIQVTYSRHGINGIFEVIETKRDLKTGQVDLVVGGLRGITGGGLSGGFGYPGHWTEEAPAFPASLGGGSAAAWDPAWTAEQKAHAKQNFGYWCDEDGFADPTDPESFLASTWI